MSERAGRPAAVPGSDRLGRVLQHDEVSLGRDGEDLLLTNFEDGQYRYRDPDGIVGRGKPAPAAES